MSKKEGRYYVEYLGWKESSGLFGREFTEPIIRELNARRRLNTELPKMTIKLTENEIQISQEVIKKTGAKPANTHYPPIPTKDTTFVIQGLYPDNDVVACIFLGYNPYTKCAVHVHVYRFDSENTAALFVKHLSSIIERPDFKERIVGIEKDLAELGHVSMRSQFEPGADSLRHHSGSDGLSYGTSSPISSDSLSPKYPTAEEAIRRRSDIKIQKSKKPQEPDTDVKRIFNSLHEELEYKIKVDDGPILLPPKDYDTIVRRHGKLDIRNEVKPRSRSLVGPDGIFGNMAQPDSADGLNNNNDKTLNGDKPISAQNDYQNCEQHSDRGRIARSISDNGLVLQDPVRTPPQTLQRQSSFASSERSNNSDEFYADGLYQGYRPKQHKRSKSREGSNKNMDEIPQLAMWSPNFSFDQTGPRSLHTHHEEELDALNRTAPASMFPRKASYQPEPTQDIVRERRVKRSHSHKKDRQLYRYSS